MQKNEKNCKKIAKKFAHIKKKLYLCTEFEKQPKKSNPISNPKNKNYESRIKISKRRKKVHCSKNY